jgi:hypothetical protein
MKSLFKAKEYFKFWGEEGVFLSFYFNGIAHMEHMFNWTTTVNKHYKGR